LLKAKTIAVNDATIEPFRTHSLASRRVRRMLQHWLSRIDSAVPRVSRPATGDVPKTAATVTRTSTITLKVLAPAVAWDHPDAELTTDRAGQPPRRRRPPPKTTKKTNRPIMSSGYEPVGIPTSRRPDQLTSRS
jgi:hypothetical protein